MRILMPCAAFPPFIDGGGPISALLLATLLKDQGHELRVLHVSDEEKSEIYEGIDVKRLRSLNLYWNYYEPRAKWQKVAWHLLENGNPRAYRVMRREIRAYKPDIVLTDSIENINVATWAAAKSLGVPVAHTLRSAFMMCWGGVMQKAGRSCERQCGFCRVTSFGRRQFSRCVDVVIGESDSIVQRHLREGYFPNARPLCIPGALPKGTIGSSRTYPKDRPFRIGFIGVHTAFKGIDVLGRAAQLFTGEQPVEFLIAGTGRDAFADQARALFPKDKTHFLGWTKPEDFFPDIDLLAFPTTGQEAFGRVAVEAFSQGVPVVGSDIGGISETIVPDVNGLHVRPGDAAELHAALQRIVDDPDYYDRLSTGALASAENYRADRIGAAYTEALTRAVAEQGGDGA